MLKITGYSWKIVIGGGGGVGKTTFINRYLGGEFTPDTKLTVGVQFHARMEKINGYECNLAIWDLGGQDRFRFVQDNYIRGAVGAIVFFDMSRLNTLYQVEDWVNLIRKNASPKIPIILGGTKNDLVPREKEGEIYDLVLEVLEDLGLNCFMATSSKTGSNVTAVMRNLVVTLIEARVERKPALSIIKPQEYTRLKYSPIFTDSEINYILPAVKSNLDPGEDLIKTELEKEKLKDFGLPEKI
ncbi:MAG: Rab family GTPase [Candidatus Hodarchaeota archaeon]